jgi:hypothetical protein
MGGRSYSVVHYQPGWRKITWEPVTWRQTAITLGFASIFWAGNKYRVSQDRIHNDQLDKAIFLWRYNNGVLTEDYVNHFAKHLERHGHRQ